MEKVVVGRRNYRRQKRYAKKNRSLRCIQINMLRHHTTQGNKHRFDKSNRSQASSCSDNECLAPTNEFSKNASEHPNLLSFKDKIIFMKRLDEISNKNMILPTTSYSQKNLNTITTIMKKSDAPDLELTMLLETIKNVYTKLQILLLQLEMKQRYRTPTTDTQQTKCILNINTQKFPSLKSIEYKPKIEEITRQQKIACLQKHRILFKENRQFKISIAQRSIRFQISIDKFNTFSVNFIQTLVNIQKCWCEDSNTIKNKPVPSVYVRDWHIRNMTQGYLLSILLRNCNVASLNTMRNLYFVIITTVTPNLTIDFNFKLPNGLIMAYELECETESPFETIYFNEEHKQVLDKAPHMNTTMLHLEDNRQIAENVIMSSYSEYSYKTVSTLKRQPSQTTTLSDESDSFVSSLSEFESEYFELQSDSKMTIKDSLNTLTYSIDDKLSFISIFNRKEFDDINLKEFLRENLKDINVYNTTVEQSKTWIKNLLRNSITANGNLLNFCLLNEGLFDFLSLNYVENIVDNLAQIQLPDFCKLFAKDLGICAIHTLFNHYPVPVNI